MGYVKNLIERLGGGYPPGPDVHVCPSCLEDEGLKKFVEAEADATSCTFCVAESHQPIAAPLVKVLLYMKECLDREYDFAENKLPYEGGYIGETWTTQELLESLLELPNDENGTLMKDLRDGLGDRQWCSNHPFSLAEDERLNFSWDEIL